jgi:hypothetical protein
MEKRTLKFNTLVELAKFSKVVSTGYLINTNNLTLTGPFTTIDIDLALHTFNASLIETSEKVFTY